MVELDVGHDSDVAVGDVRGVEAPAKADFGDDRLGSHVGKPGEGGRGDELEPGRTDGEEALDLGHRPKDAGEGVIGYVCSLEGEPLVYRLEVRARVGADGQPAGLKNGRSHPGGRALAVGPGYVDYRVRRLRIAQRPEKGPYPIEARQPEVPGASGLDRFEVYVSVEPRQRLA